MAMTLAAHETSLDSPTSLLRRFSVEEYHRMIQTGVLAEDNRVDGRLHADTPPAMTLISSLPLKFSL
jgi:hypothetical protein